MHCSQITLPCLEKDLGINTCTSRAWFSQLTWHNTAVDACKIKHFNSVFVYRCGLASLKRWFNYIMISMQACEICYFVSPKCNFWNNVSHKIWAYTWLYTIRPNIQYSNYFPKHTFYFKILDFSRLFIWECCSSKNTVIHEIVMVAQPFCLCKNRVCSSSQQKAVPQIRCNSWNNQWVAVLCQ